MPANHSTFPSTLHHYNAIMVCFVFLLQEPYKSQVGALLMNLVAPCLSSPYGHLRAKAAWVAGVYSDVAFPDGQGTGASYNMLFQKVSNGPLAPGCSPAFPFLLLRCGLLSCHTLAQAAIGSLAPQNGLRGAWAVADGPQLSHLILFASRASCRPAA